MQQKAPIRKALVVIVMGIFAIVAGVFVWQQPLYFSKDSSAGNSKVETIILIDAQQNATLRTAFTEQIRQTYNTGSRVISAPPTAASITPKDLRQNLVDVFSFNPLKIQGKAAIIVVLTPESLSTLSKEVIQQELDSFTDFLANRPGVFPQGYSLYITTITDASCLESIEYSQLLGIYTRLETQHPGVVHSVSAKTLVSRLDSCSLTDQGNKELAALLVASLTTFEK